MKIKLMSLLLCISILGLVQAQNVEVTVAPKNKQPKIVNIDTTINITVDGDIITINGEKVDKNDPRLNRQKNPKILITKSRNNPFDEDIFGSDLFDRIQDMNTPLQNKAFLGVATEACSEGVKINEVMEASPAFKAGLKVNDIITKINEVQISDPQKLFETVGKYNPADKIKIAYLRDGKKATVNIELEKSKVVPQVRSYNFNGPNKLVPGKRFNFSIPNMPEMEGLLGNYDKKPKIGISIEDLAVGDGVIIKKVTEGSLAEKAGLKVNDIILKLNDETITEVNDLKWEYLEVGKKLQFEVQRNGEKKTIELIIPKKINSAEL